MSEKLPDLNALRTKILAERGDVPAEVIDPNSDSVNTLEKFEALPIEEQIERMRQKEYTDPDLFKKKHFGGGVDINKLRQQVKDEGQD